MELLAQLIEEVSIVATDLRRRKPRQVPRPEHLAAKKPAKRRADGTYVVTQEQVKAGVAVFRQTAIRR